jgi:hypothetical protein
LFAGFEVTVGSTALIVSTLGLFYTLNPKSSGDDSEQKEAKEPVRVVPIILPRRDLSRQ